MRYVQKLTKVLLFFDIQKCSILLHLNDVAKNGGVELRMRAFVKLVRFLRFRPWRGVR